MCDIILSLKCRCIDFQEVRGKNWGRKQLTIDKRANLGVSVDRRESLKRTKGVKLTKLMRKLRTDLVYIYHYVDTLSDLKTWDHGSGQPNVFILHILWHHNRVREKLMRGRRGESGALSRGWHELVPLKRKLQGSSGSRD